MEPIAQLYESLKSKQEAARAIHEKLVAEGTEGKSRPPTDDEIKDLRLLTEDCAEIEKQINNARVVEASKSMQQRALSVLNTPLESLPGKGLPFVSRKTVFDRALENEKFSEWIEACSKGRFAPLPLIEIDTKDALISIGGSDSAGELMVPMQTGILDNPLLKPLVLRNLVTVSPVDSGSYEYVRITEFDNQAAEVGEASSVSGTSGTKPSSTIKFERVNETVVSIAHLMHTTRAALQDAGELRTLLNVFGLSGVNERLERQMIRGDGQGDTLTGVIATPNVQTPPFSNDIMETALKAQTAVALNFEDEDGDTGGAAIPNAYVMNPLDWQDYLLARDEEGRFFWGGPAAIGPKMLWGLPVVTTQAVPVGQPIVADWRYARLWDRMQIAVEVFEQHADYAARNMVLVRAEGRFGFGLIRPQAFVVFPTSAGSA